MTDVGMDVQSDAEEHRKVSNDKGSVIDVAGMEASEGGGSGLQSAVQVTLLFCGDFLAALDE